MENQLEVIVKESGLESTKAQYILDNFKSYFEIAAEWEAKARLLIVTRANQKMEMEMARAGRLVLKEKRVALENARKKLKEDALREGKAIDGIANVLKALIIPIEEYLDQQERFVEIQEEKKKEAMRLEIEERIKKEEEERLRKEAEEKERLRIENDRLAKENAEKDRLAIEEKKKADAALAAEKQKAKEAQDKADSEKREAEEKARKEREKADAEKKAIEDKARADKEKAEEEKKKAAADAQKKLDEERKEKERLEELLKRQIECPKCHHKFDPQSK